MTKEEIVKAIRVCAKKLRRNPSLRELRAMSGVPTKHVYERLGGLRKALETAGLESIGPGFRPAEETVLQDWANVARSLKKLPSMAEYESAGRFSAKPFTRLYGSWSGTAEGFCEFAEKRGRQEQWGDVLEMIANKQAGSNAMTRPAASRNAAATPVFRGQERGIGKQGNEAQDNNRQEQDYWKRKFRKGGIMRDRPVYGIPILLAEMAHAPTNEMGVLFMFGVMARRLGFIVLRLQPGFPDCIAMREVAPGQWQRVRIEFEFESRNFFKHRHRADKCDVIVCWKHNWKECPRGIEVVELGEEVGGQ